uniref:J domain-containing protein n=1 Tax=Parascaris univalens TaxID=6257 RepID=A0A914ZJW4_PARUN
MEQIAMVPTRLWLLMSARRAVSYIPRKRNYYEILGVNRGASNEEIRAAFARRSQQLHPDGVAYSPGLKKSQDRYVPTLSQTEQFMELKLAYDVLRKPERRREYDRELRWGRGELRSDELADVIVTAEDVKHLRMGHKVLHGAAPMNPSPRHEHFFDPLAADASERRSGKIIFTAIVFVVVIVFVDGIYIKYQLSKERNDASKSPVDSQRFA